MLCPSEFGFSVYIWQVQVFVYCDCLIPAHLRCTQCYPVAPYGYRLPTVYLFMVAIANPDLFVCGCRTWICLDITSFYEEQRQPFSGSAWPAFPKNGK